MSNAESKSDWLGVTSASHRLPSVAAAPGLSDGSQITQSLPSGFCQFDMLLPALNLAKYSMPSSAGAAPNGEMDPKSAQQMYCGALQRAQTTVSHAWEQATVLRCDKTMQELSQWLSQLLSQWTKTIMTCTPADLLAFLESHWLAAHAGTKVPDGSMVSSPSGVNQCLSHLSIGFSLLGRVSYWTPEAAHGNPVLSSLVSSYRKGYKLRAWRSGYLEGSAVPISEDKVHQLVDYLTACCPKPPAP